MKINYKFEIKNEEKISEKEIVSLILKNRQINDIESFLNPLTFAKH